MAIECCGELAEPGRIAATDLRDNLFRRLLVVSVRTPVAVVQSLNASRAVSFEPNKPCAPLDIMKSRSVFQASSNGNSKAWTRP